MDKYEFNLKIEQIKKLTGEGDYATALKVVEAIDWNRVKTVGLLTMASSVYEENGRLDEAKDVLVYAMERAPERSSAAKRILYKLTELSVRSGNVAEAEDYYQEYSQLAGNDTACLILQYMILKVKHAPYPQLIECLEYYTQYDPDEKWMYELATTYESAGRIQDAVNTADRIALCYGNTAYGLKALKLKQKYMALTEEQRAVLYPNSIANSGVHYAKPQVTVAEETLSPGDLLAKDRIENEDELFHDFLRGNDPEYLDSEYEEEEEATAEAPEEEAPAYVPAASPVYVPAEEAKEEIPQAVAEEVPEEEPEEAPEAPAVIPAEPEEPVLPEIPAEPEEPVVPETPAPAEIPQAPASPAPAPVEIPKAEPETVPTPVQVVIPAAKDPEAEALLADARIAASKLQEDEPTIVIGPKLQARTTFTKPAPEKEAAPAPAPVFEPEVKAEPQVQKKYPAFHLIIEAEDDQEGLDIAVEELKLLHALRGITNGAVKTSAEKLNEKGLTDKALQKIAGKDFVIEHAGEMLPEVSESILRLLSDRRSDVNVVLVDNPDGLDKLEDANPGIFDLCEYITDEEAREKDYDKIKAQIPAAAPADRTPVSIGKVAGEYVPEEPAPAPQKEPEKVEPEEEKPQRPSREYAEDEVLSSEEFAQYCVKYAEDIDCVIDGKSMLALYERIELLEEDGVSLTPKAAEDLIEETADRAEKPPIGKRLTGIFHSRYNKDGMLILKEEDFIG